MKELTCSQVPYLFCLLVCLLTRFAKFFLMKLPAVEICMPWVKLAPYSPCSFFPRCRICVLHWCVRHGQRWHYRCIIWLVTVLPNFSCIPPLKPHFSCRVDVLALTGEACVTLQLMASTFRADLEFLAVPALPVSRKDSFPLPVTYLRDEMNSIDDETYKVIWGTQMSIWYGIYIMFWMNLWDRETNTFSYHSLPASSHWSWTICFLRTSPIKNLQVLLKSTSVTILIIAESCTLADGFVHG